MSREIESNVNKLAKLAVESCKREHDLARDLIVALSWIKTHESADNNLKDFIMSVEAKLDYYAKGSYALCNVVSIVKDLHE